MICYNCGHGITNKIGLECSNCGMRFPIKCSKCNEYNPLYSKFCGSCGNELEYINTKSSLKNFKTLSESRKNVAVIFADISGFTALSEKMDPEEVRDIVNGCFDYITKPVYELEGTIDKYIGDCIMILFGAKYSHADDAKRAVKCALKMMDLIKKFSKERLFEKGIELNLSIGINYGLVVTGRVGNKFDSDYTVMGDTVNTAQRLQSSAGRGKILVSEQCYAETSDIMKYSEAKEIVVKNKEKPVKCFNALEIIKEKDLESEILFERDNEIKFINNIYLDINIKRFVNIIGESGIGKTSLIKKFCKESTENIIRNIWVNCNSMYKNKAYYAVCSILLNIVDIKEEEGMGAKKNKLMSYINFLLKDLEEVKREKNYNFLSLILGFEKTEDFNKILNSMEYKDLKREINLQLNLFFKKLYRLNNYIFIIDDIQWADNISVNILKNLAENAEGLNSFYIFISQNQLEEFQNETVNVFLNNISEAGIKEMIKMQINNNDINDIDEVFVKAMFNLTNGNPLFAKEYISTIKRKNKYFIKNNILYVNEEEISKMPSSVENIILSNLSDLDETLTMFLQIAACIGKEFNIAWAMKVLNTVSEEEKIIEALKPLNIISLKGVYTSEGVLNKIYNFNQHTVRDVIYRSILNKNKKEFSKSIGEIIEKLYVLDIENHYAELYNYFNVAENLNKAQNYSYKAAVKYKKNFNVASALQYYNIFIELMDSLKENSSDLRLVNSYSDIAYINNILGEREKALEYLKQALNISKSNEDSYSIKLIIVEIYKDMAQYDEAFKIIEDIEYKIRESSNIYGKLLFLKCYILYYKRNKDALNIAKQSEEILSKTRDYDNLSQTESLIGLIYFAKGDADNALYYLNNALEHGDKTYNLRSVGRIAGNIGVIYHATGRISKALEFFKKSIEIAKEISDVQTYISASINLGILYMEKGKFNVAESLFEKSSERAAQISSMYQFCTGIMNMGDLIYERGNFEEALNKYDYAQKIAIDHELKAEEGINYINIAKIKIKLGELGEAEKFLNKAFSILEEINETSGLIDVYRYKCIIEIVNKDFDKAMEYCVKSIEYADESDDDLKQLKAWRLKGNICVETLQYEAALELFDKSIKLSEQLESEYESAKGYYYRSKLYRISGKEEKAREDFNTAKEYIDKVDICKWTEKINYEY